MEVSEAAPIRPVMIIETAIFAILMLMSGERPIIWSSRCMTSFNTADVSSVTHRIGHGEQNQQDDENGPECCDCFLHFFRFDKTW